MPQPTTHTEVVGSLLRPSWLMDARAALAGGTLDNSAFKAVEDQAVREGIELQQQAGIGVITDGELRRYAFYSHLIDSVAGFDRFGG